MNKQTKTTITTPTSLIAQNKKAGHEFFIEQRFEAGLVLEGWEVKSLRAGRVQISDSHVIIRGGEAWLLNGLITPLASASTHISPEAARTRKLLLKQAELKRLVGSVERQGYTIVPLRMYWKNGLAKIEIALAKGKKQHDKRAATKEREWTKEKGRLLKRGG